MQRGNWLSLGMVETGSGRVDLELSPTQRARHLYAAGSTGSGKSKFFEHLIRQDIGRWGHTQCGLLLLDWHGSLYEQVVRYLAEGANPYLPVILIDLSKPEQLVRYDPLRKRTGGDPAVAMASLAMAILHAWGQSSPHGTPRLYKWLTTILMTLYENGLPLSSATRLLGDPSFRGQLISRVKHHATRFVWSETKDLKPAELIEQRDSTVSRLVPLLAYEVVARMLAPGGPSLDFSQVLDEGSIVLVSLSTAGGWSNEEISKTMGSLFLSDLWAAARERGKGDHVRPFYVYLDEFQNFVNPVMGRALDQARGFGIHMTLTQQFPSQLVNEGGAGQAVYDSVMANARTQVAFNLQHPKDLADMSMSLFRGAIDPDGVKYQGESMETLGHDLVWLTSESVGWTESETESETATTGSATSDAASRDEGISESVAAWTDDGQFPDDPYTVQVQVSRGSASRSSDSRSETSSESAATGTSRQSGRSGGTTRSPHLVPILSSAKQTPVYRSVEEQAFRAAQYIAGQPDRHCVIRVAGSAFPLRVITEEVLAPRCTDEYALDYAERLVRALPCYADRLPAPAPAAPDDLESTSSRRPARQSPAAQRNVG